MQLRVVSILYQIKLIFYSSFWIQVQKYVLRQFAQLLPHDVEARRAFVQSGGLQFLQELNETVGGKLSEFIIQVCACAVNYYLFRSYYSFCLLYFVYL